MSSAINVLNHNKLQHQAGSGVSAEIKPRTLFSTDAENQFVSYRNSGRVTISKATGQIKESHGVIFSRLQAMGNTLLQLLFGRKSIRQQNISDCLRVAIDELGKTNFEKKSFDDLLTTQQLNNIYLVGIKYFQSAKGARDFTRLLAISAKLGIKLTESHAENFNLSLARLINNFPVDIRHPYLNSCSKDIRDAYLDSCSEDIRDAYLDSCSEEICHAYLDSCSKDIRHAYLDSPGYRACEMRIQFLAKSRPEQMRSTQSIESRELLKIGETLIIDMRDLLTADGVSAISTALLSKISDQKLTFHEIKEGMRIIINDAASACATADKEIVQQRLEFFVKHLDQLLEIDVAEINSHEAWSRAITKEMIRPRKDLGTPNSEKRDNLTILNGLTYLLKYDQSGTMFLSATSGGLRVNDHEFDILSLQDSESTASDSVQYDELSNTISVMSMQRRATLASGTAYRNLADCYNVSSKATISPSLLADLILGYVPVAHEKTVCFEICVSKVLSQSIKSN